MSEAPLHTSLPPVYGIIPARYDSSRFPGKPLAEILGKPMFRHVHERASRCTLLKAAVLATDDKRIAAKAEELDIPCVMTRKDHPSGTDRVNEAAHIIGCEADAVIINIQGDEPALDPGLLDEIIAPFADPDVRVVTAARRITAQTAENPDTVKVVLAADGNALYFSRATIPYPDRAEDSVEFYGHIGLYAYRYPVLQRFCSLPPSPLEKFERLEQLRLLENNLPIRVVLTQRTTHGVDRPEDIAIVSNLLKE